MASVEPFLHPKWRDMSEWVVHFTDSEAALTGILASCSVNASGPFGWGKSIQQVRARHLSACLSEIPLDHLERLCDQHGRWGIGFSKTYVTAQGGARVWYLEANSGLGAHLFGMVGDLLRRQDFADPLWNLLPCVDGMADGQPFTYRFDWEREWRVPQGLTFGPSDVAFLLTPSGTHPAAAGVEWATTPCLPAYGRAAFVEAATKELGTGLDGLVGEFLQHFQDPVNELPWDAEEGDYVWFLRRWDTEDAVSEVFPDLSEPAANELVSELEQMSGAWVSLAEAETIGH